MDRCNAKEVRILVEKDGARLPTDDNVPSETLISNVPQRFRGETY